jgi:hypothetical protein
MPFEETLRPIFFLLGANATEEEERKIQQLLAYFSCSAGHTHFAQTKII